MKNSMSFLLATTMLVNFSLSSFAIAAKRDKSNCDPLSDTPKSTKYKPGSIKQFLFEDDQSIKAAFTNLYATVIAKETRLPNSKEIRDFVANAIKPYAKDEDFELNPMVEDYMNRPETIIGPRGVFASLKEVIASVQEKHPEILWALSSNIYKQSFLFFRHRLRPPTLVELAGILEAKDPKVLLAVMQQPGFWDKGMRSDLGRHMDFARKRIKTAYARAIRGTDTPASFRTRKIAPKLRRLVEVMIITKSNEHYQWRAYMGDYGDFKIDSGSSKSKEQQLEEMMVRLEAELEAMLGKRKLPLASNPDDRWVFDMPVLFPQGENDLLNLTKAEYQPTFTSFQDKIAYPDAYAEVVRSKIENSPGIIVSTIVPGWKIDWDLLDGMIKMSKDKGYPLILIPSDGTLLHLDRKILNHSDILLLTAPIENDEFKISNRPVGGKDPLTPYKNAESFKIGQQIIIPHHTVMHESIATDKNGVNQTQLFSTGVVNIPLVPSNSKGSMAKAEDLANQMKRAFLVAEKIDKGEGSFGGAINHWHMRSIEFKEKKNGEGSVFFDGTTGYYISKTATGQRRIKTSEQGAAFFYMPDMHWLAADPLVLKALREELRRLAKAGTKITLIFPDPVDSKSINGHVEKKQGNMDEVGNLIRSGEISFNDELNHTISSTNDLLNEFPDLDIVFQWSNHSDEWIQRHLLNEPTPTQRAVNGQIAAEIRLAMAHNPGLHPLQYLLLHRERFLAGASLDGSESYKKKYTFLVDPSRVRAMKQGEPLTTAPDEQGWEVTVQHHGHQGDNGAKSSPKGHAKGSTRNGTGDKHGCFEKAVGERNHAVGVGSTAWGQPYTAGGYTNWGICAAIITAENTIQLIQMDPYTMSFRQRPELGYVQGAAFFGDSPLVVKQAMDDDEERRQRDTDTFTEWILNQASWNRAGTLSSPARGRTDNKTTGTTQKLK